MPEPSVRSLSLACPEATEISKSSVTGSAIVGSAVASSTEASAIFLVSMSGSVRIGVNLYPRPDCTQAPCVLLPVNPLHLGGRGRIRGGGYTEARGNQMA